MAEPYLVTVIRQLADLEAKDALSPDETARLNMNRRWLAEHYPDVSAALASEYRAAAALDAYQEASNEIHYLTGD
jgi:hypothetical protein